MVVDELLWLLVDDESLFFELLPQAATASTSTVTPTTAPSLRPFLRVMLSPLHPISATGRVAQCRLSYMIVRLVKLELDSEATTGSASQPCALATAPALVSRETSRGVVRAGAAHSWWLPRPKCSRVLSGESSCPAPRSPSGSPTFGGFSQPCGDARCRRRIGHNRDTTPSCDGSLDRRSSPACLASRGPGQAPTVSSAASGA